MWCPLSLGMTANPPDAELTGCGLSQHDHICTCGIRMWRNELATRQRSRCYMYREQVTHRLEAEAAAVSAARPLNAVLAPIVEATLTCHESLDNSARTVAVTDLQIGYVVQADSLHVFPSVLHSTTGGATLIHSKYWLQVYSHAVYRVQAQQSYLWS